MDFTASVYIGSAPLTVTFRETIPGFSAVSWAWTFGGGGSSSVQNPTHVFNAPGVYDVTLVATDATSPVPNVHTITYSDLILVDQSNVEYSDLCLFYATEQSEGFGWSEFGGDDFIEPLDEWGVFSIQDDNDIPRSLCIDKNDLNIYEFDTHDRIYNIKPSPIDKSGVEGAEIPWRRRFKEETVDDLSEYQMLQHERSYVYIRPQVPENRGLSGYSATGIRLAQILTLKMFNDGEQIRVGASTTNFPDNGELCFPGIKERAHRIQPEISGTASEILVTSNVNSYIAEFKPQGRDQTTMTENTLQKNLSTGKMLHICRSGSYDLVSKTTLQATDILITGPDGRDRSALNVPNFVTMPSLFTGVAGTFTFMGWSDISDAPMIDPVFPVSNLSTTSIGAWTFYTWTQTQISAGIFINNIGVFDLRVYDKTLTAEDIAYYYNDVINNAGKATLPGFKV